MIALNSLQDRTKDPVVDKSNMIDLFLKRCQIELKAMGFAEISVLFRYFIGFVDNVDGAADMQSIEFYVPSHFRDKIYRHINHSLDDISLRVDPFSQSIVHSDFKGAEIMKNTRFESYLLAMKKFQGGEFMDGNVALNDYFDDNIFLYFENPRISSYQHFEQKKEEYKMAVEHTSLKKVGLSLQTFHMEASSKLLEETLRWAQLNHHETEVQYCLLYKARSMAVIGENKLHFTFVEDALVKALACNNYFLQVYSCIQHMGMDNIYDLKRLKKEIGQNRNLNSGMILNNAFGKLLMDGKSLQLGERGFINLYHLRSQIVLQRRDYLMGLGLRKKNNFIDKCNPTTLKKQSKVNLTDLLHLEGLLDESVSQFNQEWQNYLDEKSENLKEYQIMFFDAYFQSLILMRRRDLDTIGTYYRTMERILTMFPEPLLVTRLWMLRIDLLIEKGGFEEAYCSCHYLLQTLESRGYTKVMCLLVKYRVALIYLKTGKYIKTLEEINSGLSKTKENSLNDIYVQFKLLQIQVYLNLQFYDQCLTKLRKLSNAASLSSQMNKLTFKELEVRVCLMLVKAKKVSDKPVIMHRVSRLAGEALELARKLENMKSIKQLSYIKARVHSELSEVESRNRYANAVLCITETEQFIKSHAHSFYSLDDSLQSASINRHLSQVISQSIKQAVN